MSTTITTSTISKNKNNIGKENRSELASENNSQRANTTSSYHRNHNNNYTIMSPSTKASSEGGDTSTRNNNNNNNNNNDSVKHHQPANSSSTPVRSNYAAPHTPIASAKRPRNPNRSSLGNNNNNNNNNNISRDISKSINYESTPSADQSNHHNNNGNTFDRIPESSALSPMHPARLVHSYDRDGHTNNNNNSSLGTTAATTSTTTTTTTTTDDSFSNGNLNECGGASPTTWGALFSPVLNFLQPCSDGDFDDEVEPQQPPPTTTTQPPPPSSSSEVGVEVERDHAFLYDQDGDVSMDSSRRHLDRTMADSSPRTPSSPSSVVNEGHEDSATTTITSPQQSRHATTTTTQYHQHYNNEETVNADAYLEDDVDEELEEEEEEEEEFNPYLFIQKLPPYTDVVDPHTQLLPHLPPKSPGAPPITLVLDLDETLVHCTVEPNTPNVDMVFPVVFHGMEYQVHVKKRPHLEEFLRRVYREFEVVVFTASQRVYADELLDRIDPENKYIKHRMFRESCLPVEGNYLKDLNVLGRDLRHAVLVDNSPHAFGYQVDNGIPIESWFEDPHDTELLKLEAFLRTLQGAKDVRPLVRDKFKTFQLIRDA